MVQKARRGKKKQPEKVEFSAAIETIKKDYASLSCKLRENDTQFITKTDQVLQHIKSLYEDPQLPSEYEVEVSDLYEKIKNDLEALDFVKKLGTTIKTRAQSERENMVVSENWVSIRENRNQRQLVKLEPLYSSIERAERLKRKSKSFKKVIKKKKHTHTSKRMQSPMKRILSPKTIKKKAGLSSPLKRALRTSTTRTDDVWTFRNDDHLINDGVQKTSTRSNITKEPKNHEKNTRNNSRRGLQKIGKNEKKNVSKKKILSTKEVIEQASVFDFDDVKDPYA